MNVTKIFLGLICVISLISGTISCKHKNNEPNHSSTKKISPQFEGDDLLVIEADKVDDIELTRMPGKPKVDKMGKILGYNRGCLSLRYKDGSAKSILNHHLSKIIDIDYEKKSEITIWTQKLTYGDGGLFPDTWKNGVNLKRISLCRTKLKGIIDAFWVMSAETWDGSKFVFKNRTCNSLGNLLGGDTLVSLDELEQNNMDCR